MWCSTAKLDVTATIMTLKTNGPMNGSWVINAYLIMQPIKFIPSLKSNIYRYQKLPFLKGPVTFSKSSAPLLGHCESNLSHPFQTIILGPSMLVFGGVDEPTLRWCETWLFLYHPLRTFSNFSSDPLSAVSKGYLVATVNQRFQNSRECQLSPLLESFQINKHVMKNQLIPPRS